MSELVEQRKLEIKQGTSLNILIEGENLAVLRHLTTSYSGGVDVIYVDPPYNTGMESLNYDDNNYADACDEYVHSKWLSFIYKRLRIAYDLLSRNGVMFIQIDEHETGTLLLLCQSIFGETNVVALVLPRQIPSLIRTALKSHFTTSKSCMRTSSYVSKTKTTLTSVQ